MNTTISQNLATLKATIAQLEETHGRTSSSVSLLAVSKGQPVDKILLAYEAGQRLFGENYLQEALDKMEGLGDKMIEWHYIGPIQRNKTRKIAENFQWVQSVDSVIIAQRLNDQRPPNSKPLNICIQVNISQEASKAGVADKASLFTLAKACLNLPHLKLRGLMAIPKWHEDEATQQAAFHALFLLQQELNAQGFNLDTLSMGMSDDFPAAIAQGSTLVRIGTRIFGDRDQI